jgi:hypothetical protein
MKCLGSYEKGGSTALLKGKVLFMQRSEFMSTAKLNDRAIVNLQVLVCIQVVLDLNLN